MNAKGLFPLWVTAFGAFRSDKLNGPPPSWHFRRRTIPSRYRQRAVYSLAGHLPAGSVPGLGDPSGGQTPFLGWRSAWPRQVCLGAIAEGRGDTACRGLNGLISTNRQIPTQIGLRTLAGLSHSVQPCVLVIYCCITNTPKLGSLKQLGGSGSGCLEVTVGLGVGAVVI